MKVQYCGLSDKRSILATDTINGAVVGGAGVQLDFSPANNFIIDTTNAPYNTAAVTNVLTALKALPHGEFVDVTSTSAPQAHITTYGNLTTGVQATTHTVTSGAPPTVASGAGTTGAAIAGQGANDSAGAITATSLASGNAADTPLVTVVFAQPYSSAPKDIELQATNTATEAVQLYPTAITANGFTVQGHVAAGVSQALAFDYSVKG